MTSVLFSLAALAVIGGGSLLKGALKVAFLLVLLFVAAVMALGGQ